MSVELYVLPATLTALVLFLSSQLRKLISQPNWLMHSGEQCLLDSSNRFMLCFITIPQSSRGRAWGGGGWCYHSTERDGVDARGEKDWEPGLSACGEKTIFICLFIFFPLSFFSSLHLSLSAVAKAPWGQQAPVGAASSPGFASWES